MPSSYWTSCANWPVVQHLQILLREVKSEPGHFLLAPVGLLANLGPPG